MPRRPIVLPLALVTILASPSPAGAADPPRACVAVSVTAPRCHPSATFEQGRPVVLRATTPGAVWRRSPQARRFVAIGRTDDRGRWKWIPLRRDVNPAAPYTFRVAPPGGTPTNAVEVWIVPRHG